MLISIIIPAYNEEKLIKQTIAHIKFALDQNIDQGNSWEIIVCDNNSTDKTAEIASAMGAKIAQEPINQISRARNTGAKSALGSWLLFLDADSYPSPELITEICSLIEIGNHVGCGATIQVVDGTLLNKLRMERLNPIYRLFNISGGGLILCQKQAFESISGFSTHLFALEEIDFFIRLKRYARMKKKSFSIIDLHPIFTSGRRGDYRFFTLVTLFASNYAAVLIFILSYIFPKPWIEKLGARFLGYWYDNYR